MCRTKPLLTIIIVLTLSGCLATPPAQLMLNYQKTPIDQQWQLFTTPPVGSSQNTTRINVIRAQGQHSLNIQYSRIYNQTP